MKVFKNIYIIFNKLFFFCLLQEHLNLIGRDPENGPVLVSIKAETVAGQEHWRVLLRLRAGSAHELVPAATLGPNPSPVKMVKVSYFRAGIKIFFYLFVSKRMTFYCGFYLSRA